MSALQSIKASVRFYFSPEAPWRLPDQWYLRVVQEMSELCCIPLYQTSSKERVLIARFYASNPRSAVFILLKAILTCNVIYDGSRARSQAQKIMRRIFGKQGMEALTASFNELQRQAPNDVKLVEQDVLSLIECRFNDETAVKNLSHYADAVAAGERVAPMYPGFDVTKPDVSTYIGAHWLYCGDIFFSQYEAWLTNERLQAATQRLLKKIGL